MTPNDHTARFWSAKPAEDRLVCELCPRFCALGPDQRGMCFVRKRQGQRIVLDTWGRSSGFCIDPIEKKPLNHFLPGTAVLSFGTAGCNLACKFCQNHDISKSRETDRLSQEASADMIANAARNAGAASVALTYNDPVIFHEYAVEVALAARARGVKSVAVTAGYITPEPRAEFFAAMDAANIDLKGFSKQFYRKLTGAHLAPVLETIEYAVRETDCWVELTTLLIPGQNDSDAEIIALAEWVLDRLGPEVPVHFSAFHPAYRMLDLPRTPHETLLRARARAMEVGLRHVYVGNVHDKAAQSSYCTGCGEMVIGRDWYALSDWHLTEDGHCTRCGTRFHGVISGPPGDWGRKRQPVRIVAGPPPKPA
ncbi:AmmeMemoRadiSam system radical SAM enzyme [Donghicola sp. C2-DW-16]|uniref:AmmeMemoRadiSam system radical SAM enzyme n=1 Tax=Donghicola mangrovi TaxID=2729614 RepID=A0ABX2PIE3_9RHOB|nr:AmmeMemoRadiSam system radical SAM enzyme [Donghicola mangrovi]NVO29288.1 AmmeMemoRadiSam system radical SAM enzyme [Donghicola mangrovi]